MFAYQDIHKLMHMTFLTSAFKTLTQNFHLSWKELGNVCALKKFMILVVIKIMEFTNNIVWQVFEGIIMASFDLEKVNKTSIHTSFATKDILYFHELHDTPWLWGWSQIKCPSMHLSQQGISFMVMNYITPYHEGEHVMLEELFN